MIFLITILEDISPFCGATDTLFWTSDDVYPWIQSQVDSLACMLCHLCAIDSSESPLV